MESTQRSWTGKLSRSLAGNFSHDIYVRSKRRNCNLLMAYSVGSTA